MTSSFNSGVPHHGTSQIDLYCISIWQAVHPVQSYTNYRLPHTSLFAICLIHSKSVSRENPGQCCWRSRSAIHILKETSYEHIFKSELDLNRISVLHWYLWAFSLMWMRYSPHLYSFLCSHVTSANLLRTIWQAIPCVLLTYVTLHLVRKFKCISAIHWKNHSSIVSHDKLYRLEIVECMYRQITRFLSNDFHTCFVLGKLIFSQWRASLPMTLQNKWIA